MINERARVLYDVLTLIKQEHLEITNQLEQYKKTHLRQFDNAKLKTLISREITLELDASYLQNCISRLIKEKQCILSPDNAQNSASLCVIDPFSVKKGIIPELGYSYFSSSAYKKMQQAEDEFNITQKQEFALIRQRFNLVAGFTHVSYLVAFLLCVAAAASTIVLVNPIVGFVLLGAVAGLSLVAYSFIQMCTTQSQKRVTEIKATIDLGFKSNPNLFQALDTLEKMSPMIDDMQEKSSLNLRSAA